MKPSQTIGNIKEKLSTEESISIESLDAWCIEYDDNSERFDIEDEKPLKEYLDSAKKISSVFVKEAGFEPSLIKLGTLSCFLVRVYIMIEPVLKYQSSYNKIDYNF